MKLTIPERPGVCRWCGCTDKHGCALGCRWANRRRTLCSRCIELDVWMRCAAGRAEIAQIVRDDIDMSLAGDRQ